MGIPSVTVVTEPFEVAARATARALGMEDLPMIIIPHDYLGESEGQIDAKVETIIDRLLDALT
jgi:hypothetical protein